MMPDMAERINTALIAALPVSCYYKYIATAAWKADGGTGFAAYVLLQTAEQRAVYWLYYPTEMQMKIV
jgi:hypothetical protein